MKSSQKTVDLYLKEVDKKRLPGLKKIRELCLKHLPGFSENMQYNMPSYMRNNQVEVAFASQKQHISVYFLIHEVMVSYKDRLQGLDHGKGCIRFSNPEKIDFALITDLLKKTHRSETTIC